MKYDCDPIPLDYPHAPESEEMLTRARDYVELISRRRSVQHFSDKPVSQEKIETCLQAAGSAPSGANHQPWHFVGVSDSDIKRKIRVAAEEEEQAFLRWTCGRPVAR